MLVCVCVYCIVKLAQQKARPQHNAAQKFNAQI